MSFWKKLFSGKGETLTMLMVAAGNGAVDIVNMAITAGEEVNAKNKDGLTALMSLRARATLTASRS